MLHGKAYLVYHLSPAAERVAPTSITPIMLTEDFTQRGGLADPLLRASGEHTIHPCPERSI
ncbi:MAG: hypothetical protein ACREIK_07655, partial [Nitrospiraceae bacterium]